MASRPSTTDQRDQAATLLKRGLVMPLVLGVLAIVLFARSRAGVTTVMGTAVLVSMAALASGLLVGFLFGIPRSRQAGATTGDEDDNGDGSLGFVPNTNLEQVSDWLTKILLGATLTQLGSISDGLGRLVDTVGDAWGPDDTMADVFAGALLLYFAVFGFLAGWLLTRAFLAWALSTIDRNMIRRVVAAEVGENLKRDASQVVRSVLLEQDVEDRLRTIGLTLAPQASAAGPDFVCQQDGKRIALEVKHRDGPMSLAELQRFTMWDGTDGCVLVTDVDLDANAQSWVASKPNIEVIRWEPGSEQAVTEALARVSQQAPAPA